MQAGNFRRDYPGNSLPPHFSSYGAWKHKESRVHTAPRPGMSLCPPGTESCTNISEARRLAATEPNLGPSPGNDLARGITAHYSHGK